jgi:predicted enzyme related to lactoylglutathione lyase
MPIDVLFVGVATADLEAATPWYEALLGRAPDIIVNADEVMWKTCEGGWLYLVKDSSRAGHALAAMAVSDLDDTIAGIVDRGLDRPEIETINSTSRKAPFTDPEGNVVALIEVLASSE